MFDTHQSSTSEIEQKRNLTDHYIPQSKVRRKINRENEVPLSTQYGINGFDVDRHENPKL